MQKTIRLALLTGSIIPSLMACTPMEHNHGNLVQEYQAERITSGKHTKQSVLKIIGSPTTRAPFDDNVWYYIGQKSEAYGIARPEIVEQTILEVQFNDQGFVEMARYIDAKTFDDLPIVDAETPTAGTEENPVRQFLNNLGRFNQPVGAANSDDGGVGGPGLPGGNL